jgi:CMP-N,N'-diacetyllegionaminic acid synthase
MYGEQSLLALIPARSGSKGLPNKNVMQCAGKPLIGWTISAANSVSFFDDVIVSTDTKEIADIARNCGASIPFIRPKNLSSDTSSIADVVKHAWESHQTSEGAFFDYVVLLQATSPLRMSNHIESAIEHFFIEQKSQQDTLASVFEVDKKNGWLMEKNQNSSYINFCFDSIDNPQRQKLKSLYMPNGAIFIIKGTEIDSGIYHQNTIPYIMDISDSEDIDTLDDLKRAENKLLLSK